VSFVASYRITQLRIEGMRCLDRVELDLATVSDAKEPAAPTVLIGPNGAGKSTLVEACELLRKAGTEHPFIGKLFDVHGGPPALLRRNVNRFELGVRFASSHGVELTYEVALRVVGRALTIERETATASEPDKRERDLLSRSHPVDHDDDLVLAAAAFHVPELKDIQSALASIEIHTAIDARAAWATAAGAMSAGDSGARASNIIRPVTRVEQGGRNLPNVYHALRNQKDWPQTLERIRLALGDQIEDVLTPADPSGGRIGLALRVAGVGEVPAFSMSDGQLSYLALLGVLRLQRPSPPALVVFDEPDLHLHPALARRLMADLEAFARSTPVLVATQSDAMLDALSDPGRSSVLCELDEHHATRLVRPDRDGLQRWLVDYRGLGDVRAAGYEGVVFPTLETP
jgi:predicted ATPase